ncbi:MAG: enoyl-CoA hydratase [Solirubrobacteraceae bacterium]|nr:enoyl-CoA hydratase [Solirubrobacteraceae bacterium]
MPAEIRIERDGGVAILTLAAPARRNALTVAMAEELVGACDALDTDASVGAVIVAAEGKTFCAGGDRATLAAAGADPAGEAAWTGMTTIYRSFARVGELAAPTIAAVAGHAVGAGLNLALATDLRVVAEDAVLTSGFIPIGLHPGGGHTALLSRTGGREAAAALALFGERIDGRRAVELGLAWRAVPAAAVLESALELARVPAADPALARRTAASLRTFGGLPWPAALDAERAAQMWSMRRAAEARS